MGKWKILAILTAFCAVYDISHGELLAMQVALIYAVIAVCSGVGHDDDGERRNEYNPANGSPMSGRGRGGVDMTGNSYGSNDRL